MPESEFKNLIRRYDALFSKFMNLRIIACGGTVILDEKGPSINRLLRQQEHPELCEAFADISNALLWLRDELMNLPLDACPVSSAEPPISL